MKLYVKLFLVCAFTLVTITAIASDDLLIEAVAGGSDKEVNRLLKSGASPDTKVDFLEGAPVLLVALLKKNDDITRSLLNHGANPNFQINLGGEKSTPLLLAIKAHNLKISKALIDAGADLELSDYNGTKPLHMAVTENQVEIVKYILKNGGNIDTTDNKSRTALHWATLFGFTDIVADLVENGANVNAKSVEGYTPLKVAVMKQNDMLAKYLESKGGK